MDSSRDGAPPADPVKTSLELHIRYADGRRVVVAIGQKETDHAFPGGPTLRFSYHAGSLTFRDLEKSSRVYKEGHPLLSGPLEIGATLDVAQHRVMLWDTEVPAAFLKGYTAPFSNDIWLLGPGEHAIGRPGLRPNAISLDHPTVSRAHARIIGKQDGSFQLLAEAVTNPVYLKGEALEPGRTVPLRPGDLMEVGELIFRFHQPGDGSFDSQHRACISVSSLGGLRVTVAGQEIPDKAWRTPQIKWLFARLAYAWGRPLGTEALSEELWPGADREKARSNFKFSLSTLRGILRDHLPAGLQHTDTILKSSTTSQLNPDLLDRHDAVDLQRLAHGTVAGASWEDDAQQAVLSYRPFLSDCSNRWAAETRQALKIQVLDLARSLLARLEQRESWDGVIAVATHIQAVDRQAQWPCLFLMRALRQTGQASRALEVFDQCSEIWIEEFGAEPEIEMLQEQQLALSDR